MDEPSPPSNHPPQKPRVIFGQPALVAPEYNGPNHFCWLIPGLLGGTPRPGIFKDASRDLAALQRVNTRLLVTLTEEYQPDTALNAQHNIDTLYAPIQDLAPPTPDQAKEICQKVSAYVARGEAVVFHCHAGKGRTGTLLAAMLIWAGSGGDEAILETRRQNPKWIESESQLEFLRAFPAMI